MKQFNKVDLGVHSKRSRRPLYYEVNSTAPWGVSQPCMVQKIDGKSRIVGNYTDLLRLSPLPVPTYANMYKETTIRFVPISQICPYYENMLVEQPTLIKGRSMLFNHVPEVSNSFLVYMLIYNFCTFNQFRPTTDDDVYKYDYSGRLGELISTHYGPFEGSGSNFYIISQENLNNDTAKRVDASVTLENADFVLRCKRDDGKYDFLLCRLNRWGRILRSNLIGCGYSLNIDDDRPLSLLPLFAYYKAYYDTYFPQRNASWQNTRCYDLINRLMSLFVDVPDDDLVFTMSFLKKASIKFDPYFYLFSDFLLYDLSRTFATSALDIVSACRDAPENSVETSISFYDDEARTISNQQGNVPRISGRQPFTSIGLKVLDRLTRFVSKKSAIGEKLSKKLSLLYNADLSNSTIFDSNRIGYYRMDCRVNPIFSTSDTASVSGEGEYLGSFAGTGFAQSKDNSFDYTSSEIGYVVSLTCVLPDSSYYQGNQYDLHAVDRDTIFNSQYDAVGYEIFPYGNLVSDNGISFKDLTTGNNNLNTGFGYLPRYSQLKSVKNIVNGDMSRRGTIDSMSAYYLDKQIVINSYELSVKDADAKTYNFKIIEEMPPQASEEWQYPTKYSWLGNYDRIFYNSGSVNVGAFGTDDNNTDDNFMFQMSWNYSIYDNKLPVSRSYCTYDEDDQIQQVQQS